MDCPVVALIVFNRPDLAAQVFEVIRSVQPRQLLLIADGPRDSRPTDAALCTATRDVLSRVDWQCEVERKYADRNLGCGPNVSQGIDWVFGQVEEAMILEDDSLPHPSFFPFCAELLDRYRNDSRVMQISGMNYGAPADAYLGYSYGFNSFAPIPGWATWRRAWREYDFTMATWPEFRDTGMMASLPGRRWHRTLRREWDRAHAGESTWDHQWQYTIMSRHGFAVSPCVNLVSNVGFGPDATQTALVGDLANIPTGPMAFPLRHPPLTAHNPRIEQHMERTMVLQIGPAVELFRRIVPSHRLRRFIKRTVRTTARALRPRGSELSS